MKLPENTKIFEKFTTFSEVKKGFMQSFDRFKSVSGLRIGIESVLPDLEIVEVPTAEGGEGPVEPWPQAPSLFRPFPL